MESIDTHLFIEIILTEGAILLNSQEEDGLRFEYYMGPSGFKTNICVAYEFLSRHAVTVHLYQMDMPDIIGRLGFS